MDTGNGLTAERGAAADGLPDDSVVEILSRVPARSIHRFKCVAKTWRDLIADPLNRKRLPQTLEGFFCIAGTGADFRGSFVNLPGRSAPFFDPSFSFLTKLPGIENLKLLCSCNGLFLFEHGWNSGVGAQDYAVCNPATEQWVAVPSSGCPPGPPSGEAHTYLIFDPAVSPHFHLVNISQKDFMGEIEVCAYSSESRVWSDRTSRQSRWQDEGGWKQWVNGGTILRSMLSGVVNGVLHLGFCHGTEKYLIAAMDMEGKTCRIITWPDQRTFNNFVGQSQGHLHCVGAHTEREGGCLKWAGLSIWVLEDYDTEEWVLKQRVSFLELFGQMSSLDNFRSFVVAIHPDRNLIFIIQHSNRKLISYDMESKELHAFHTLGHDLVSLTPYVPNFMELVATNGH